MFTLFIKYVYIIAILQKTQPRDETVKLQPSFRTKLKSAVLILTLSLLIQIAFGTVSVIVEPQQGRAPVLRAIKQARKSIKMEMYLLSDHKIIDALIKSAKRGVNIQVLLEQNPYQPADNQATQTSQVFSQLSKAGVNVKWANPHFQLTHEKTMIIDHKIAYIFTFNQTYSAFKFNREYGVIDSNKNDVTEIEKVFDDDWLYKTPKVYQYNLLWSPINSRAKILTLVNSAKHYLYIETEELNDWAIESALMRQARLGVDVRVIMPKQTLLTQDQTNLIKGGIKLRFLDQDRNQLYMHAKMILADGKMAYIGSENLTFSSLRYNRELGIILYASHSYQEKHILKILEKTFLIDWGG